jgi:hypothetical protein
MRKRILYLGCGMILVCIIITGILVALVGSGAFMDPRVKNAKAFLQSAIEGRESDALAQTSPGLRDKIHQQCPDGLVTKCIEKLISPSWGKCIDIQLQVYSPPDNTFLFYTLWSNYYSIPVVLIEENQNGTWVIRGWRGFTATKSENEGSQLLYGTLHDNEFLSSQ